MLGYEREEIAGLNFASLLSEDQLPSAMEGIRQILENGAMSSPVEFKLRRKDGGTVHIETIGSLIYREGEPYATLAIARDITERKRADEALRESEEKYRFLTEGMNDIVWTNDLEMNVTYVSPSVEKILGFTVEERMRQAPGGNNHARDVAAGGENAVRRTAG